MEIILTTHFMPTLKQFLHNLEIFFPQNNLCLYECIYKMVEMGNSLKLIGFLSGFFSVERQHIFFQSLQPPCEIP